MKAFCKDKEGGAMEANAANDWGIIGIILGIVVAVLVTWILLKLNKYFFRKSL